MPGTRTAAAAPTAGAATATAEPYKILMSMRKNESGVTDDDSKAFFVNSCGEWKITKDFKVERRTPKEEITTGYIAQLVEKSTEVTRRLDDGEVTLRTSAEISEMTRGNTNFMTHSYIELFEYTVDDEGVGEWDGDQFMNGVVVPFDRSGPWCVNAKDKKENKYHTKGTIIMKGTVIFIPAEAGFNPASESFKKPKTKAEKAVDPANGLLSAPYNPERWARLCALKQSPFYKHNCKVTWAYPDGPCASVTTLEQTCDGGKGFLSPIISAPNCPGSEGGGAAKKGGVRRHRRTRRHSRRQRSTS